MPNETGTAFLVDPKGRTPRALNPGQYEKIQQLLELPGDFENPLHSAIDWLLYISPRDRDLDAKGVLGRMIHHYLLDEDGVAVLADGFGKSIEGLTSRDFKLLQDTLVAIRAGGWFAEWLALQVTTIATSTLPEDCYPTPLKVAASLVDCIRKHEETMEVAREVVRMRPDLIQAEMRMIPEAAPEPLAAEPAESSVTKPATTRRTRKPRKAGPPCLSSPTSCSPSPRC